MAQGKTPEKARQPEDNGGGNHELEHELAGMAQRFDQQTRRDIGHDHHRNNPAEDESEKARENYVRIARNIEKVEITVDQTLRANNPKADGREAEHDGVMNGDAETQRGEVKQNRQGI